MIDKFANFISKIGVFISSIVLLVLVVLILVEIVGRSFFSYSTMIADEYSGYFFLALCFFGFGFTFLQKGHIRINIITSRLESSKNRLLDIIVGIFSSLLLGYALFYSYLSLMDAKELEMLSENVSQTPIYLTQIPVVIGLGIFLLVMLSWTFKRMKNDS